MLLQKFSLKEMLGFYSMKYFQASVLFLWMILSAVSGSSPEKSALPDKILWQIGEFDDADMEFSLAPNRSSQYDLPGIHVPGITDPSESWPYILPGKLDTWAGPGPQTFEVIFYLEKAVPAGDCRLTLDFLDTHSYRPPRLSVEINGLKFEHQAAPGNNDWHMAAPGGTGKEYKAVFKVPAAFLREGENRVSITAAEGSWALWDALSFEVPAGVVPGSPDEGTVIRSVRQKQLLVQGEESLMKPLELEILHTGETRHALLQAKGATVETDLLPGIQRLEIWVPETAEQEEIEIEILEGEKLLTTTTTVAEPVRRWEVHLIHQTHLDIGFTHTQEEVLEMQTGYLYQALDLIDKTKHYPEEARFRWHPEGMWAIDEFLRNASVGDSLRFMEALKDQYIHLDAFYVHLLSGLATGEELIELMRPAKSFESRYGIPVRTAIGSDIPGYSWGMVAAMAGQGIEFFNMAPNNNYKLGYLYDMADKPFYWLGPDGYSKVLTWMASHAYIWFWNQDEGMYRVPRFLDYLERSGFPYEIAMLRYEVGGDNGYPDPTLPDQVREWNEKYVYPRIILSTNTRLYESFTERYDKSIPVYSGDLTPYWEDGAASTAADLAMSRRAGERLLQARALEAILKPGSLDAGDVSSAWNKVIMYDEHTWGAYCSKSDPYDPFTTSQEKYKKQFAMDASEETEQLAGKVIRETAHGGSGLISVWNTTSWDRSELVLLSPEQSSAGNRVLDDRGKAVASQRLASGELAFMADHIPGFGSRRYTVTEGEPEEKSGIRISVEGIANELISIGIDTETGSVKSIRTHDAAVELVDTSVHRLNDYIYVEGRETGKGMHCFKGPVVISVEDPGPLVGTLRIESGAPGAVNLVRRVRLVMGKPDIEIINTVDKLRELEPEGVYFAFPLNIPGGTARIDIPWGVIRPEADQLPGANRNYFPVQRWMDISNEHYGVTWVTVDAPMIKFAPLTLVGRGRGDSEHMAEFSREGVRLWWNETIHPGPSFYSWVMNNHWEVNYKAFQEGPATFSYHLIPHMGSYDGPEAEKKARAYCQPLIAVETASSAQVPGLPFSLSGDQLVATSLVSLSGDEYLIRLYNPGAEKGEALISGRSGHVLNLHYCDPMGRTTGLAEERIVLQGFGIASFRIQCWQGP